MTRVPGDSWTDERIAELKRLAGEGFSCSQIAAAIGGVSRNAVIGKLHRLGDKVDRTKKVGLPVGLPRAPRLPRWPRAKRKSPWDAARVESLSQAAQFEATEPTDLPPEDTTSSVPFFEAGDGACRWPLTDPAPISEFRFCGAAQLAGCSYCARHYRMGHQGPQTRARERSERRAA